MSQRQFWRGLFCLFFVTSAHLFAEPNQGIWLVRVSQNGASGSLYATDPRQILILRYNAPSNSLRKSLAPPPNLTSSSPERRSLSDFARELDRLQNEISHKDDADSIRHRNELASILPSVQKGIFHAGLSVGMPPGFGNQAMFSPSGIRWDLGILAANSIERIFNSLGPELTEKDIMDDPDLVSETLLGRLRELFNKGERPSLADFETTRAPGGFRVDHDGKVTDTLLITAMYQGKKYAGTFERDAYIKNVQVKKEQTFLTSAANSTFGTTYDAPPGATYYEKLGHRVFPYWRHTYSELIPSDRGIVYMRRSHMDNTKWTSYTSTPNEPVEWHVAYDNEFRVSKLRNGLTIMVHRNTWRSEDSNTGSREDGCFSAFPLP